jgi:chorismate synthase
LTSIAGRVAAGAIAEKYLSLAHGVEIIAFTSSVGPIHLFPPTPEHPCPTTSPDFLSLLSTITRQSVDAHLPTRCPNPETAQLITSEIEKYRDAHDSIGGTVTCVIRNLPLGLGEPAFDKLEALLAHAMLSIPATKGFEIGSGFLGTEIPGSRHNDPFVVDPTDSTRLITSTNNSGGIQGGISNGAPVYFRVAFKPPATIGQAQTTARFDGGEGVLEAKGRHDPCVVPRAVPIVEAMAACVVMDMLLAQYGRERARSFLPAREGVLPVRETGTSAGKKDVEGLKNGLVKGEI